MVFDLGSIVVSQGARIWKSAPILVRYISCLTNSKEQYDKVMLLVGRKLWRGFPNAVGMSASIWG